MTAETRYLCSVCCRAIKKRNGSAVLVCEDCVNRGPSKIARLIYHSELFKNGTLFRYAQIRPDIIIDLIQGQRELSLSEGFALARVLRRPLRDLAIIAGQDAAAVARRDQASPEILLSLDTP